MSQTTLHPVGDGYYEEWDTGYPDDPHHYANVDDDPHDSGTSTVSHYIGVNAGNITPFLRLNSTDNFGTNEALTISWVVYTEEIDRPGGGSWSKSDLGSLEMGIRTIEGLVNHNDSFTTDSNEIATIPDSHTIEKVEVQFVGQKSGGKTQTSWCTAVRLLVTHVLGSVTVTPSAVSCVVSVIAPLIVLGSLILSPSATSSIIASVNPQTVLGSVTIAPSAVSNVISTIDPQVVLSLYPAPTDIEIDYQSSPATNVSEAPKFTAIFNGNNSNDVAVDVKVHVAYSDYFGATVIYSSGWLSLSSPGCAGGERCEGIIYGTGDSGADVLSSHPILDEYYVRFKFRDSLDTESEWSDTVSGEPSTFSGINRDNALPGYAVRRKLYVNTDHSAAIPAGWDLEFSLKTGERTVAATNGCFNEAVQASGGFQIEGYGSKLYWAYMSEQDPTHASGNYAIYITESSDGGETWETPVKIATAGTYLDTHYFPTLVIDKLGYIHVAYGAHGGSFKYTHSTNSVDISSWSTPTTITGFSGTYPVGILVPTKGGTHGRVYWFWRNSTAYKNSFIYSDNGGSTWSSVHDFIADTNASKYRVYCYGYRYDLNAERLHIAYTHNHTGDVEKGVWYAYSDLDEVDSLSGDYGFNIWHWADDDVAGYSSGASGSAVDYNTSKAIVIADDHLARTFIECLELDSSGEPIVFWEQKAIPKAATNETYLVCATWNGSSWDTHYISDQVNRMLRVRRSSVGLGRDKDNVIRAIMPVRAKTWWHLNPTGDLDSVDVTPKSEVSNYLEVDEGPTDCDKDGSYCDIKAGGKASFSSTTDMIDGTREIFTLEIEAITKEPSGDTSLKFYVDNGATEYDSSTIYITSTYAVKSAQWDTNPFTSNPWTKSDLDSLQFGIKNVGSNDLRITRIFARARYTLQSDEEWCASEIFELTSSDNGATWKMSRELSRNSGIGTPIMNSAHHLHNDRIHVIWTSGFDLFYFTDKRFGLVQFTGDDLRIYYAGAEIDRVLDYANKDETLLTFKCQAEIPANRRAGPDDYYVYYGNPNEATAAKSDPHEVYHRDFQNYEQYNDNENLNGQDGWAVTGGTALAYGSPPSVSNKVGAGELSAECNPSAGNFAMVKTIGSGLTNVQLDIFFWLEATGGDDRAWAEFEDSGGNIFGAGLDNGDNRAAYKVNSSWTNSNLYANYKSLHHLRLRITSAGCSAWLNGNLIVSEHNDSTAITSVDKLRLCCNALTFFDFSRIGYSWVTHEVSDPEVIVQAEEWQGYRIDATLLGRGSDSYIIDATIWGYKMGSVSLVTDAVNPTIVMGSTSLVPAVATVIATAVDPTVIGGDITISPNPVAIVVAASAPTIVLGSLQITPDTVSMIVGTVEPTIILGSVAITATVSAVASSIAPIVLYGSTTTMPEAASLVTSRANPAIILGSLAITPSAASLIIGSFDPTVLYGSTIATPDSVSVILSTETATVVYGSMTVAPGSTSLVTASANPQVNYGSIVITSNAVNLVTESASPTLHFGSTTAIPAAIVLITGAVDPHVVGGSIDIMPTAADAIISSVNPGVVIGAVTVSPVAVSAIASVVNPAIIFGSVTAAPTASNTIATANDCTVHLGSTTQTPEAANVVLGAQAPTVIVGSAVIAPAAAITVISTSDPTTVLGSQAIAPAAADMLISVANPTVTLGNISITATTSTVLSTFAPTVIIGDVTVSPTAVSIVCSTVAPLLVFSSTSASPAATTVVTATVSPDVVLSWVTVSPAPVSVTISGADPSVVVGSVTVTPDIVTIVTSVMNPAILLGSTTAIPSAIAAVVSTSAPIVSYGSVTIEPTAVAVIATVIEPAVVYGSTSVTPAAATVYTSAGDPTVILGSVTVQPTPVSIVLSSEDPSVIGGSASVSPAAASVVTSAIDPVVVRGSLSIQPAQVSCRVSTTGPAVIVGGITVSPEAVAIIAGAVDPATVLGSTQVSPISAVVYTSVGDPVLVLGSLSISPEALDAIAGTANPTVLIGALVISPASSQLVTVAVSPDIILGATVSVPNPVSAVADSLAPTVVVTGVTLTMPDGRSVVVGQDDRMFTVPADDRGVLVQSEDRMSTISRNN